MLNVSVDVDKEMRDVLWRTSDEGKKVSSLGRISAYLNLKCYSMAPVVWGNHDWNFGLWEGAARSIFVLFTPPRSRSCPNVPYPIFYCEQSQLKTTEIHSHAHSGFIYILEVIWQALEEVGMLVIVHWWRSIAKSSLVNCGNFSRYLLSAPSVLIQMWFKWNIKFYLGDLMHQT